MLRRLPLLLLALPLFFGCASTSNAPDTGAAMTRNPHLGRVRHVVLFKFKDGTAPADIEKVVAAFAALRTTIPQIRDYEWGTDMSPEGLQQGLTHAFLLTFDSAADRDAYLPHPAHKAFVDLLSPLLDRATVLDYVARDAP